MSLINKIQCDTCSRESQNEKQQRSENWIELEGQLRVWLETPRKKKNASYMHSVGYSTKKKDFCSIDCLVKALKAKESIP